MTYSQEQWDYARQFKPLTCPTPQSSCPTCIRLVDDFAAENPSAFSDENWEEAQEPIFCGHCDHSDPCSSPSDKAVFRTVKRRKQQRSLSNEQLERIQTMLNQKYAYQSGQGPIIWNNINSNWNGNSWS